MQVTPCRSSGHISLLNRKFQNCRFDLFPISFAEQFRNIGIDVFVMTVFGFHQFGNGIFHAPVFKRDTACGNGTSGAVAAVPAVDQKRLGSIPDDGQNFIEIIFGDFSGVKGDLIERDGIVSTHLFGPRYFSSSCRKVFSKA